MHVDLCGPFPPSVHTGFKYVIGFADRATREVHVYFLVHKTGDEVRSAIETFTADHGKIKQFVFDNGGDAEFGRFLEMASCPGNRDPAPFFGRKCAWPTPLPSRERLTLSRLRRRSGSRLESQTCSPHSNADQTTVSVTRVR